MDYSLREMRRADLPAVLALWNSTEELHFDGSDTEQALAKYLRRNAGLCFVAGVKCGHDGRRGYLHHLAVRKDCRRHGIGKALVDAVLRALNREGIEKCNTFVLDENPQARAFWEHNGWTVLDYCYRTLQKQTGIDA